LRWGAANARLQHTGQVISLCYLPPTLRPLARAVERSSIARRRRGVNALMAAGGYAGVLAGLMAIGRDQVRCRRSMCSPVSC
jgi:hypothetical protein